MLAVLPFSWASSSTSATIASPCVERCWTGFRSNWRQGRCTAKIRTDNLIAWIEDEMTIEDRYRGRYQAGQTPWDIGKPDFNLVETVTKRPIAPCKALDIGCGTGDNAIWLAQRGFEVTGIDASDVAIEKAKAKALEAKVKCEFAVTDIRKSRVDGAPFGFAFDRGCFHSFDSDQDRKDFAEKVSDHLEQDGLWLSLIGNADERRNTPGPPQRTAKNIVDAVELHFEILSLVSSRFGSNNPVPPRAWVCLMRKRRPA